MKKLMFAALVSAACCGFAEDRAAQVYDLSISVKTTTAKSGSLKANPFVDPGVIVYRTQTSQKWTGVIWGCDCNALAGVWQTVAGNDNSVAGCAIWRTKPAGIIFMDDLNWRLLNAIDKKGDKCEGSFTIGEIDADSEAFLCCSGFGTLSIVYTKAPCEDPELNCTSYLKSMSGNVAGWMPAPVLTTAGRPGTCVFCGEGEAGEDPTSEVAEAWDFCPCEDYADVDFTAVSGTWKLKYNAKLSKKLMTTGNITDVYKFPADVKAAVLGKIAEVLGK